MIHSFLEGSVRGKMDNENPQENEGLFFADKNYECDGLGSVFDHPSLCFKHIVDGCLNADVKSTPSHVCGFFSSFEKAIRWIYIEEESDWELNDLPMIDEFTRYGPVDVPKGGAVFGVIIISEMETIKQTFIDAHGFVSYLEKSSRRLCEERASIYYLTFTSEEIAYDWTHNVII